jgi:hypothetical protein
MMRLVFDIDGTVRDLNKGLRSRYKNIKGPKIWDWSDDKGQGVYEYVSKDFTVLEDAPPTKYVPVIQKWLNGNSIEFWSNQPDNWKKHTNVWLSKYFKNYKIEYLTPLEKEYKLLTSEEFILLFDDYPKFRCYDRIIVVDQEYNRQADSILRLKTTKELEKVLNSHRIYCGDLI